MILTPQDAQGLRWHLFILFRETTLIEDHQWMIERSGCWVQAHDELNFERDLRCFTSFSLLVCWLLYYSPRTHTHTLASFTSYFSIRFFSAFHLHLQSLIPLLVHFYFPNHQGCIIRASFRVLYAYLVVTHHHRFNSSLATQPKPNFHTS